MGASTGTGLVVLFVVLGAACCTGVIAACARCRTVAWLFQTEQVSQAGEDDETEQLIELEAGNQRVRRRQRRAAAAPEIDERWLAVPSAKLTDATGAVDQPSDTNQQPVLTARDLEHAPDATGMFRPAREDFDRRGRAIYGDAWDRAPPAGPGGEPSGLPLKAVFSMRPSAMQDLQARARAQARALASEKRARRMPQEDRKQAAGGSGRSRRRKRVHPPVPAAGRATRPESSGKGAERSASIAARARDSGSSMGTSPNPARARNALVGGTDGKSGHAAASTKGIGPSIHGTRVRLGAQGTQASGGESGADADVSGGDEIEEDSSDGGVDSSDFECEVEAKW